MKRLFRLSESRPDPTRDVDDEIRFHLEMRAHEFIEQGLAPEEARQAAVASFGDVPAIEAECRGVRVRRMRDHARRDRMHGLALDLTFALRTLRQSRGFTLAAVLTLALGIGANTAMFSAINRLILNRLPFAQADRLVYIHGIDRTRGISRPMVTTVVDAWRERAHSLQGIELYRGADVLFGGIGEPAMIQAEWVPPSFLPFLGLSPAMGRTFTTDEAAPGGPTVAMLGYAFWQRRFDGSPSVLGRVIDLAGKPYTVIGVMPHQLQLSELGGRAAVWLPLPPSEAGSAHLVNDAIGRLRPGTTLEQAQRELAVIQAQVPVPGMAGHWGTQVIPAGGLGNSGDTLLLLAAAVAVVLLIACANVAHLFLARGIARRQEMVVRAALGAGRARLVRQLFVEGLIVAGAGGTAGVLLAWCGARTLGQLRPSRLALVEPIGIDERVLLFALIASVASALLFALLPALRVTKLDLGGGLRSGSAGSGGAPERARTRSVFIAAEVALSVVLLTAAGFLVRQMIALQHTDAGFHVEGLAAAHITLPRSLYPTAAGQSALAERLEARATHLAGVESAAVTQAVPTAYWLQLGQLEIEGGAVSGDIARALVASASVPTNYFRVLGIPILEGRGFTESERRSHAHVMVIGQALAHALAPTRSALGMRLRFDPTSEWSTVVGIVGDVAARPLGTTATWQAYTPFPTDSPVFDLWVVARANPGAPPLGPELRRLVHTVDPRLPIQTVATMESVVQAGLASTRFRVLLLTLFAGMALVLAIVGLFGMLSYTVARRTRELGIRMALGARASSVRALVVRQGMVPAAIGLCVGLGASLAFARVLSSVFHGIHPHDPVTFGVVAAVVLGSTLLASYFPARRATSVDPVTALRRE